MGGAPEQGSLVFGELPLLARRKRAGSRALTMPGLLEEHGPPGPRLSASLTGLLLLPADCRRVRAMLDNPKGTRRVREIRSFLARLRLENTHPLLVVPPGDQGNSPALPNCGECLPREARKVDPLVRRRELLGDVDGESRPIGAAGLAELGAPIPWGDMSSTRKSVQREEVVSGGRNIQRVSLAREGPKGAAIAPQVQLRPQGLQIRL